MLIWGGGGGKPQTIPDFRFASLSIKVNTNSAGSFAQGKHEPQTVYEVQIRGRMKQSQQELEQGSELSK